MKETKPCMHPDMDELQYYEQGIKKNTLDKELKKYCEDFNQWTIDENITIGLIKVEPKLTPHTSLNNDLKAFTDMFNNQIWPWIKEQTQQEEKEQLHQSKKGIKAIVKRLLNK